MRMVFDCSDLQKQQLEAYLALLSKWNKAYNLTAIRDYDSMVVKHIYDSLSIIDFVEGQRVVDVGTGAGLPGIPLAIWFPDKQITLLDSNGKKTRFLTQAIFELGLTNCTVVQSRVEDFQPELKFDCITSRAFADLSKMLMLTQHLSHNKTQWLAMKGEVTASETQNLPASFNARIKKLDVPDLYEARHLVILSTDPNSFS